MTQVESKAMSGGLQVSRKITLRAPNILYSTECFYDPHSKQAGAPDRHPPTDASADSVYRLHRLRALSPWLPAGCFTCAFERQAIDQISHDPLLMFLELLTNSEIPLLTYSGLL
jgi:hypothetical protein